MEHGSLRPVPAAPTVPQGRSEAPHAGGRRASYDFAEATAGAENRTVQTTDETPQCYRRHTKRVGPRPRFAAGSLLEPGQSEAPKLLHRRGLQCKTLASPRRLGIAKRFDCQTERRIGQLKSRKGRFHFKKCFPARLQSMMGQSRRPSGSRSPINLPGEYHK